MVIRKFVIAIITKFSEAGIDKANKSLRKLSTRSKKAAAAVLVLDDALGKVSKTAFKAAVGTSTAGKAAKKSALNALKAAVSWSTLGTSLKAMGPLAAKAALGLKVVGLGVLGVGAAVIGVGASFESFRAQLGNLLGGEAEADAAFKGIQKFAKNTPFQVDAITGAFIKLTNQGIEPTEKRLTAFGDIAAANGKELDEFTEAVLDAAVGENERLKEFGIKASAAGKKVAFSFRGQTIEVEKNKEAITEALVGFGQIEGIAGSMAVQMDTAKGVFSNLKDAAANFLDVVSRMDVLEEFKGLMKDVADVGGDGDGLAGILASSLIKVLKALRKAIQSITKEDVESFFVGFMDIANAMATVLDLLVGAFRTLINVTGSAEAAFATLAIGTIALQAAFMGPAGLVFAAGAAGVAIGALLNKFLGFSDGIEGILESITGLNDELAKLDALNRGTTTKRGAPGVQHADAFGKRTSLTGQTATGGPREFIDLAEAAANAAEERALSRGISEEGAAFFAQQAREDVRDTAGTGRATRSATEAIARGEGAGESPLVRRAAMAALEQEHAGDLAKLEGKAAKTLAGKKKKKGKKGSKKADPFDFRKKAESAAKSQAVKFAEAEVERLVASGVESTDAIRQAAEAGRATQDKLLAKFLKAGKIFDTSKNILDVLGLKGPGSVMEKRPAPQTLIINLNVVVKMIERLEVKIVAAAGTSLGENAAAAGAEIASALEGALSPVAQAVKSIFEVNAEALVNQQGGGRQLPGVSGG